MTLSHRKIRPHRRSLRCLWIFLILASLSVGGNAAYAQTCNDNHTVVSGESLSKIANTYYGDLQKWSVIYNVNLSTIGDNPNLIFIGQILRIPCLDDTHSEVASTGNIGIENSTTDVADAHVSTNVSKNAIRFLTADDYAPFTDRKLINGGIVTDLLQAALSASPNKPQFVISWVNDWSVHLDPLLSSNEHDLGFPWLQPDCVLMPEDYRCQNFKFSFPVFEMLILLFTDKDRPISFNSDADMEGAVLCRPKGYYTHDLEKDGRLWLTNNVIELKQPDSIKDCFDLLTNGDVDAVALNEFTGRSAISELLLTQQVEVLENRPISREGLHVVVHKSHPRAQELIEIVNESMANFQLTDAYNEIIDRHFRAFWSKIE
ncbi:MAG: transporter substrate-binding domain-containing protein [Granulosicoccaceae bacterium]